MSEIHLNIAKELRIKLPNIIKDLNLEQMWGFKYDSNLITKEINNITTGTILLTEKVLPTLRKQKESKIIKR